MRQSLLAMLVAPLLVLASSAMAQTTAPGASPGTPAAGAPGAAGGLGSYWWLILLVLLAAGAAWYFMKGRNRV